MNPQGQGTLLGGSGEASRKYLIVNADDYGYTAGVSAGIRRAHREGIVTSTSVMMAMPNAATELARLRSEAPGLGVGVHLTITEGRPFRLARFFAPSELSGALSRLTGAELRSEWQAQIDAFLATGLQLTHLDSHHHAAYRHENALAALFELAREYGVAVRKPYPLGVPEVDRLADLFTGSGVRHPSRFVDAFDKQPGAELLLRHLESLPVGVTEIMVHPGLVDDELRQLSPTFAEPRAIELASLIDARVRESVDRLDVELTSFALLGQLAKP